ncbi:MAG: GntR family transcriptional regulator [Herbinix sp.]|nr:GntR family transcriptional regulator [Herbinix sp.]
MLDSDSATPLYLQVADDIKQKIASGEYKAGQILPSETKCCEIYQVSRVTIRNAISDLVDQGLLVRKHGKGSYVEKQKIPSNLFTFSGFTTTCRENNIQIKTHILCALKQEASMNDLRVLNLHEGDYIVYLKRLRFADEHPVIIEHVHLPYDKYKFLLSIDLEDKSLYEIITEHTGLNPEKYCNTKITLEATAATPEEAHFLNIENGKPLIVYQETVISNTGEPVHWTKQIMSGNYFKFYLSNNYNKLSINLE